VRPIGNERLAQSAITTSSIGGVTERRRGAPKKIDSVHVQIANFLDEIVDIHLHYSASSEKFFLLSVLPGTCVWLPSVPVNTHFSAYSHVRTNEQFYSKNTNLLIQAKDVPDPWLENSEVNLAFSEPNLHGHDLLYIPRFIEVDFVCDTCSITISKGQPVFLCSHYPTHEDDCSYTACTSCFYEFMLSKTIKLIEEDLSLTVEGERWWGTDEEKPKISQEQNNLVNSVLQSYVAFSQKDKEPVDVEFIPFTSLQQDFFTNFPEYETLIKNTNPNFSILDTGMWDLEEEEESDEEIEGSDSKNSGEELQQMAPIEVSEAPEGEVPYIQFEE